MNETPPFLPADPGEGAGAAATLVGAALHRLAGLLPEGVKLDHEAGQALANPDGPLDSLGIVNLVVALEDEANEAGIGSLGLLDALALPLEESPFRTVGTLQEWVARAGGRSGG